jgi:cytochrome c biogenesis protein CcmG/thiol:disulfide interchange protein DsbE
MSVKRLVAIAVAIALLALGIVLARAVMTSSGSRSFPAEVASGRLPQAPDFTLPNLDRNGTTSLADLSGQIVVLNFWASWCDPCKDEAPILEDFWVTEAKPNGVAFVGIDSQDLTEDALAFAEDYGLTYPLVHDDGGEAGRDYGVSAFPETFVLDAQGRAVAWFPGEVTAEGLREAIAKAGGP